MSDRAYLHLADGWALGFDRLQWILLRGHRRRAGGVNWVSWSFIGSTKAVLLRVLRENGVVLTDDARRTIDGWPDRFADWLGEIGAGGKEGRTAAKG